MSDDRRLRLHIWTGNAAFGETEQSEKDECAEILRKVAMALEDGMDFDAEQTLFDRNGNDVGRVAIKSESEFEHGRISEGRATAEANEVLADLSYPVEL